MNAIKWPSLTEFAKFLGREGICRVEETDKGIHIAWIDNSPEALRRQDAIRKKERQDKGDEEREQMLIREQVRKAKLDAEARARGEGDDDEERELKRADGEKIKLNFSKRAGRSTMDQASTDIVPPAGPVEAIEPTIPVLESGPGEELKEPNGDPKQERELPTAEAPSVPGKVSVKMGIQSKPKNVFAAAKNTLAGKKVAVIEQPKKMSEAERIMKEEIERKRRREGFASGESGQKRQRF
jgi:DNA/RNA-binding protein KIN17